MFEGSNFHCETNVQCRMIDKIACLQNQAMKTKQQLDPTKISHYTINSDKSTQCLGCLLMNYVKFMGWCSAQACTCKLLCMPITRYLPHIM